MFENSFSFNGRIGRMEYIISFLICSILMTVFSSFIKASGDSVLKVFYYVLVWLFISQGVKRCNDIGRSYWWMLVPFFYLWMFFERGKNRNSNTLQLN